MVCEDAAWMLMTRLLLEPSILAPGHRAELTLVAAAGWYLIV